MNTVDAEEPVARIESELGLLMRRARSSSDKLARAVHPDLEPSAYPLLIRIAAEPGIRASALATYFGIGRGTVSRQLGRLADLGLIDRQPDPDDSRGQLLRITDEGSRHVEVARTARRKFLQRALDGWSPVDRERLANLLGLLNTDLALAAQPRDTEAPEATEIP